MPLRSHVTATFSKKTYSKKKGFEFPAKLHALFGFRKNDRVALLIARPSGEVVFCGISRFTSGTEVTEVETCRNLELGEDILVTASRAPTPRS